MLEFLLKHPVVALREQPGEVAQAYEEQKILISLRKRGHTDIVKMLQTVTSEKRTFIQSHPQSSHTLVGISTWLGYPRSILM